MRLSPVREMARCVARGDLAGAQRALDEGRHDHPSLLAGIREADRDLGRDAPLERLRAPMDLAAIAAETMRPQRPARPAKAKKAG